MEDNAKLVETLLKKATEYAKTSYELAKLKALDKISDISSILIVNSSVMLFFASFLIFLNFGISFWLGEILGKIYYGFFVVAAFYVLIGIILQIFFNKCLKKRIRNFIIKQALK
ncbi:MAG: phage holin family protein [Bacteroidia bacterium]|nr:phage holin family protein [Bacteroidia bacterium]